MSSRNVTNFLDSNAGESRTSRPLPVGIYGWRKRCLYALVMILLVTVIINIALTVWMLRVMDFSVHGMGKLRIVDNGLRLEGDAEFLKGLFARKIFSGRSSGLEIRSNKSITLFSQSKSNTVQNSISIAEGKVQSYAEKFQIFNSKGKLLFSADNKSVAIDATLSVMGEGGTTLSGSLQTPLVRSHSRKNLRIESQQRSIHMSAGKGINIRASGGSFSAKVRDEISFQSISESIMFDAKNITMKGIPLSETNSRRQSFRPVYQLCVCGNNGKLFRSQSEGNCEASIEICS